MVAMHFVALAGIRNRPVRYVNEFRVVENLTR